MDTRLCCCPAAGNQQSSTPQLSSAELQGFWDYLLFTPCDLWPYLRGRTLWVVGDSQVSLLRPQACAGLGS